MPKSSFVKDSYIVLSDYFDEKPDPVTLALLSVMEETKEDEE